MSSPSPTITPASLTTPKTALIIPILSIVFTHTFSLLKQKIYSTYHYYTYKPFPSNSDVQKNVIVIGGSYAGTCLAKRLADTLPSGWRVVMVEKNSHFNHLFNLPRYSVLTGHERKAFVPYTNIFHASPPSISHHVRGTVTTLHSSHISLSSGEEIPFEYLALATGTKQLPPANLRSSEKEGACTELKILQEKIKEAKKIAVVGGGAVGVQLVGDIVSFYHSPKSESESGKGEHGKPGKGKEVDCRLGEGKEVTLIHSRDHLLSSFGSRLGLYAKLKLEELGVRVVCGQRPALPERKEEEEWAGGELVLGGKAEMFDLIIPTTGPIPNSSLLSSLSPSSIFPQTKRILVKPTLQLLSTPKSNENQNAFENIFALGDVAETHGPKMARAGMAQADIVTDNILSLIQGKKRKLQQYRPTDVERSIGLSMGKDAAVMYLPESNGREHLFEQGGKGLDLGVEEVWKMMGAGVPEG